VDVKKTIEKVLPQIGCEDQLALTTGIL